MSGWRLRSCGIIASLVAGAVVAACGAGPRQDVSEPKGNFPIDASARWTSSQHLSQHTQLVITAKNAGRKAIPDVAVTITDGTHLGTEAQAFQEVLNMPGLANSSRPVWIVDKGPGSCGYSCQTGGPGADVTAYSNTWALGHPLKPGQTATFEWHLTAVQSGTHVVNWRVAAGLNGKAKAVTAGGTPPEGRFTINISQVPQQSSVNGNGQVTTTP